MQLYEVLDQIMIYHGDDEEVACLIGKMRNGNILVRKRLAKAIARYPADLSPRMLREVSRWGVREHESEIVEIRETAGINPWPYLRGAFPRSGNGRSC